MVLNSFNHKEVHLFISIESFTDTDRRAYENFSKKLYEKSLIQKLFYCYFTCSKRVLNCLLDCNYHLQHFAQNNIISFVDNLGTASIQPNSYKIYTK